MLAAINPQNTSLVTKYPVCHSQGELLYLIGKNNIKEVFVDKDLPGSLSINAFIHVIKTKYPDVEVSVVEPYIEPEPERIRTPNVLALIVSIVLIQTIFNIIIQYSILAPRNVIYAIIAGFATLLFFYGGYKWTNSKQ